MIMAIVTISEASKLVGKTTRTIQRHVVSGKISKTTTPNGLAGIDTSELIRVYGQIKSQDSDTKKSHDVTNKKDTIVNHDLQLLKQEITLLKVELDAEKKRVEDKQETIDTLKNALKILEYKQIKNGDNSNISSNKKTKQPTKRDNVTDKKQSFINRFKNIFK